MSLHKQSDVKNHLSPRFRTKIHLCDPASNTATPSVDKPDAVKPVPSGFTKDSLAEHSSKGEAPASTGSINPQAPAASKSTRQ
ncbi:MAG: hypothetical protein KGN79_00395 [Acidobacteriota bacterium]|nr:hypothetical protein [Acidobacteriota bacterium]